VLSSRRISGQFAELGHEVLHQYAECRSVPMGDASVFYQRSIGICFDDLGTEEMKKNYGNQVNVMAEVILNRYDNKHKYGWHCTHVTTNLTMAEIESEYGTRVRSRFTEMFNQIVLHGSDRRKTCKNETENT
jgi:hydrogenase maturation factor HypF (carbamoyltransferase family)